jgi:Mg/Co/Ni transporter MgtE
MPADKLVAMVKDWENDNLARVFRFMDAGQSTKILASLDPKRASSIVKIMQAQASEVPNPELKK